MPALLARFDTDGDGTFNQREFNSARAIARIVQFTRGSVMPHYARAAARRAAQAAVPGGPACTASQTVD